MEGNMGKLFLFFILWRLFGNPFIAILVVLVVLYFIDRRYLGLTPSFVKPLRRRSRIAKLRQQLMLNPNDTGSKMELARLLLDKKDYKEARKVLESIGDVMEHSAEFWDDLGNAYLHTADSERGEQAILRALEINPRVKYGQPYLRLAALHSRGDADRALAYLRSFGDIQSSSAEAYYRMGLLYMQLGRKLEAKTAFGEAVDVYRSLPKYKKREQRKWALRSFMMKARV
jgi:tetratricopeptide (TPR) repeat protein